MFFIILANSSFIKYGNVLKVSSPPSADQIKSTSPSKKAALKSSAFFSGCFFKNSSPFNAFGMYLNFNPKSFGRRSSINLSSCFTNGSPSTPLDKQTIPTVAPFLIFFRINHTISPPSLNLRTSLLYYTLKTPRKESEV